MGDFNQERVIYMHVIDLCLTMVLFSRKKKKKKIFKRSNIICSKVMTTLIKILSKRYVLKYVKLSQEELHITKCQYENVK